MANQALQQLGQIIASIDDTYELPSINTLQVAVQVFDELFEEEPKQVMKKINQIIAILETMVSQPSSSWLMDRAHLLDFVISVVQKFPKIVTGKNVGVKDKGTTIIKIGFDLMTQVSSQTTQKWMNPDDGFKVDEQEDVDYDVEKQVKSSMGIFFEAVGFKMALIQFQPLFLEYIQKTGDWRYQYAALVVASQLGVEGCKLQALGLIVQWAMSMTENYHPKVRYASLHLLGQYSTDLSPQFQEMYFDSLIPITSKMLNDSVPRVVAHVFSCITNFFEVCNEVWKIENCLGVFLNPIVHSIKTGSTLMKECALSTLSSFAVTEDAFGPNLPSIFQLGYEIISSCAGQSIYKQLLNQCFQLLSILFAYQKKQLVVQHLSQYIMLLCSNRESIGDNYYLKSWNRICQLEYPFTDLAPIYDSLLSSVKNMFNNYEGDDDCAESLDCLINTFKTFKSKASPFVAETLQFAKQKFQNKGNSMIIREKAVNLVVRLFTETRPEQPELLTKWYHQTCDIYKYICKEIEQHFQDEEFDSEFEQLSQLFEGTKELIKSLGSCLTGTHLISLAQKQIFFVRKIEHVYTTFQQFQLIQNEIDSAEQDVNISKNELFNLEEAVDSVPDIMEELLKLSVEPTTKETLIGMMRQQIEASIEKKSYMLLYGIGLAVSILQSISAAQMMEIVSQLLKLFIHFSAHPSPRIRNGCVYGMSLAVKKVPSSMLAQDNVTNILNCLSSAYLTPFEIKDDSKDDQYFEKHCKDNVISALGNLLKYFGGIYGGVLNQQIYSYWLSNLPLNTDKIEGNQQQEFLISILRECPSLIIKDAKDLKLICQIYARFVKKRSDKQYREIIGKTKDSLLEMQGWQLFKSCQDYLMKELGNNEKQVLSKLLSC